jgi:hypothetical protein
MNAAPERSILPMPLARTLTAVWSCSALALLSGCPNPNAYTTPRTLDPGKVQWQIAPEVIGVNYNTTTTTTTTSGTGTPLTTSQSSTASAVLPMVPTFGARVGMLDGFDMGFRLQNLDSLAIDGKIRLLKGQFDIAVDPGLQGFYLSVNGTGAGVVYMHLPVLLGLNVSRNVSIVASPGVVYAVVTASENGASGVQGAATATGFFGRLGLGVDIRTSKSLAIHPEITVMRQFSDVDALVWVAGIGFNIGAQPDYSDLGGGGDGTNPPPEASPSAAPAPASAPKQPADSTP